MAAAVFAYAKEYDINLKLSQNASTCSNNIDSLDIVKRRVSSTATVFFRLLRSFVSVWKFLNTSWSHKKEKATEYGKTLTTGKWVCLVCIYFSTNVYKVE